jgi:spore coat protein H
MLSMARVTSVRVMLLAVASALLARSVHPAAAQDAPGDRVFAADRLLHLQLIMTPAQFDQLNPPRSHRPGPGGFGPGGFGPGGFGPGGFGPPAVAQPSNLGATPSAAPAENAAASGADPREATPGGEAVIDSHRNTFGVEFPWSEGELIVDGVSYPQVGVRYKGNYTYMVAAQTLKKSFKVDFNRHVKGQKLDGLTMINLHNGVSDPTAAREAFSYAFFNAAGVPAPRTVFAELTLTVPERYQQELVGVYTLTEQVNKPFLKRHFGSASGMLLKPEGLQGGPSYRGARWSAYERLYQPEDPPSTPQKQRLIDFTRLISLGSDEEFRSQIGEFLEVEAFLRFIAANALLSNLDSYLGFGHNYYLYLVPHSNRFVFIPWDVDLSLATWPAAGTPQQQVELSLAHPHAGENRLLDRVLSVDSHRQRYEEIVRELAEAPFRKDRLLAMLEPIEQALMQPLENERRALAARAAAARHANPEAARSSSPNVPPGFSPRPGGGFGGRPGTGPGTGPGWGAGGLSGGLGGGQFGQFGQFGQSLPPRAFIELRTRAVAAQLAGETAGYIPHEFGGGALSPPGAARGGR